MRASLLCFLLQAEASTIVTTAHQINSGTLPTMQPITAEQLPVRSTDYLYQKPQTTGLLVCNA